MDSKQALEQLKEGNKRFTQGLCIHPNRDEEARDRCVEEGQSPFATILACSDSRVPVEVLFDQGIGDLFVIRNAGNVLDDSILGTLDFAVKKLKTPVIVILGHSQCGAVTAAVEKMDVPDSIQIILDKIEPSIKKVKEKSPHLSKKELISATIRQNIKTVEQTFIDSSELVRQAIKNGDVILIGAYYHLQKGEVEWVSLTDDQV